MKNKYILKCLLWFYLDIIFPRDLTVGRVCTSIDAFAQFFCAQLDVQSKIKLCKLCFTGFHDDYS